MGTAASPAIISGSTGSFTLQSGATLGVTSPAGISANGTNTGNIQVIGTRSYSAGNINYMGNSAEATGNGLTAAANVSITNTGGIVTFTVQAAIAGNYSMVTNSTADLGTGFIHTAASVTLGGVVEPVPNSFGGACSTASMKNSTFFPICDNGIINVKNCSGFTWIGVTSTDWNTASNWCPVTVPIATDDIIIQAGTYQPVIGAAGGPAAVCQNITITSSGVVTVSGSNTLTVYGTFTNLGSFITNNGTVTVNGDYTNNGALNGNTGTLPLTAVPPLPLPITEHLTPTLVWSILTAARKPLSLQTDSIQQWNYRGTGPKTINADNFIVLGILSMELTGTISALPTYGVAATFWQYNEPAAFTASVEWETTFTATGGVIVKNTVRLTQ